MSSPYEDAVEALYRGARESFVAERKALAAKLKASGEREAAARLAKLPRPNVSAWAVNQLYWRERALFERFVAQAARLRSGDVSAAHGHREALQKLRSAATSLLREASHAPNDLTLRRITTNLAAIAASGGFEPDSPGALTSDRDPPGFESMGASAAALAQARPATQPSAPRGAPRPAGRAEAQGGEAPPAPSNVHTLADAARARAQRSQRAADQEAARAAQTRAELERKRREEEQGRAAEKAERRRQEKEQAERRRRREEELARAQQERLALQRDQQRLAEQRKGALRAVEARTEELTRRRAELASAEGRLSEAQVRLGELDAEVARLEQRLAEVTRTLRER